MVGVGPPLKNDPMNSDLTIQYPDEPISDPIVRMASRAESYVKVAFVEWFADPPSAEIDLYVFQPECSIAVVGKYNPSNGFCEVSADRQIGMNRGFGTDYICKAVTFQNYYKDCYGDLCETSPNCLSGNYALI